MMSTLGLRLRDRSHIHSTGRLGEVEGQWGDTMTRVEKERVWDDVKKIMSYEVDTVRNLIKKDRG